MNTVTISKEFSALKDFTTSLPQTFDRQGRVIYNSRNVIKKVDIPEGSFVVKNFKGMYFFNRLAYSLFRKSKAARSYLYSTILNRRGIITPPPVGWIDCYSMGLLTRSYFVSVFSPHRTLQEAIQYYNLYEPSYKDALFRDLAAFIAKLHSLKIYHEDLSVGNILVIRRVSGYDFALVDLNRVKFRKVSPLDGLRNLITLRMAEHDLNALITEYAKITGLHPTLALQMFWKHEKRKGALRRIRKRIRSYTVTPIEKLLKQTHLL